MKSIKISILILTANHALKDIKISIKNKRQKMKKLPAISEVGSEEKAR